MVLLWTLLISIVSFAFYHTIDRIVQQSLMQMNWLASIPLAIGCVAVPLSGWLADAKFGNYKVLRFGAVLLFTSTVVNCSLQILEEIVWESNSVINSVHICLAISLFVIGCCACVATALPLGLDQMPDASTSSITSYIAWFVGTFIAGLFLGEGINLLIKSCVDETVQSSYHLIWSFALTVCMSVILLSNFLFNPKWLIIEPKSPQSLKTIYKVLKFAAKHKAPLNRSALTYWEEDIPSRIDLGKTKYGGPFTIEQVEDVKTILRLLAIIFPLFFLNFSHFFSFGTHSPIIPELTHCKSQVSKYILKSVAIYGFLGTLAYEFLIFPLVRNKLPSILKRIGVVSLTTILVSFVCFILKLAHFLSHSSETTTEWIVLVLYHLTKGTLGQVLLALVIEFMCAQSPYNMRGLLISLVVPLAILSASISAILGDFLSKKVDSICTQSWCPVILISVKTA